MGTVAGIFNSRTDAERAVENLRSAGIADERISLLAPGTGAEQAEAEVPTTETEQPGLGKALGGVAGTAIGAAGGMHLGAAIAGFFVPGVGPIFAAGVIGAALLGAGGAAAGIAAGGALEDSIAAGLPHDELYVYEDALRQGRAVVIAVAEDNEQSERARGILDQAGAESIDAARENWWLGLRDAEEAEYTAQGRDFKTDEANFRRGFEAAVHPKARSKSFDESVDYLRERFADVYTEESFRRGYERGQAYYRRYQEKYKS